MQKQNIRQSFVSYHFLFQIIMACGFGLLLGIACGLSAGWLAVGLLIAALVASITIKRAEVALLGILLVTSSILFEEQLPLVSAGGISLQVSDFLLLGMLGLLIVRWLAEPGFKFVHTPLDWPLLLFYGALLLSSILAMLNSSLDFEAGRRGVRVITYYLTFFVVTNFVIERRQLNLLVNGIFLMATITAGVMVAQYILGDSVKLLPGRVEELSTEGVGYSGITRILPPGVSIVWVSFITVFCILILENIKPHGWLEYIQFGLLGMALLFSFLRSYWGASVAVFFLLFFILRGQDRKKLVNRGVIIIVSAVVVFLVFYGIMGSQAQMLANASSERFNTVFRIETYTGKDNSLNSRKIENEYAFRKLSQTPWLGVGMKANYRPWDSRLDYPGFDGRDFIHNGHLNVLLRSGVIGYLCFLWLTIVFLVRGFKYWRGISSLRMRGVFLGFTLVCVALLMAAYTNSFYVTWSWTPVIGIMMGVNENILRIYGPEEKT